MSYRVIICYNKHLTGRKEGNVLFNDALNTFYLRLYGVRHMVKDHSDSEKGNPLPPHRLLFPINSKGSFICTIPDRIAHTMAFVTPVVEHWLALLTETVTYRVIICYNKYLTETMKITRHEILHRYIASNCDAVSV